MKGSQKGKGSIILRIAVFGLAVYMIISLSTLWGKLVSSQNTLNKLNEIRLKKSNEIAAITALLEGSEDDIIEKAARERLGYVYADEQVYRDKSGN